MISLGHNELIVWLLSEGLSFSENAFQIFFMVIIKIIFTGMCWYLSWSSCWWWVNIGSGDGLISRGSEPLPFLPLPILRKTHAVIELTHWGQDKMAAIFQTTFLNAFSWMKIYEFQLKFHWNKGPINNIPAFVQVMAWRRPGDKPLSDPMMVKFTKAYMRHSASMS